MKPVISADGSHTVWSSNFNAHYHSIFGAIDESKHVFIDAALLFKLRSTSNTITILEYGLGTGLNLFLSFVSSIEYKNIDFYYQALEAYPITPDILSQLNYCQIPEYSKFFKEFSKIHSSPWGAENRLSDNFKYVKHKIKFQDFPQNPVADIVYYDAFSPGVQPELWEAEQLHKVFYSMVPGAILTSYCAKGSFKRALKAVGFTIESLKGPAKKREMTRAMKPL
ncbi:MAG: tRNA (5-methylaminomethyl-2-thiouridine)(34)-methyltransferase MnmD [Melioribacteraceae bacterium]|nr:tRNA (5-methylaminomethyl-2-thiouridine)(34)-methyltransferase MnmD [Melioribacteraceae bacterium]